MKTINILHVASFSGNIGDNANHIGFRGWFEKVSKSSVKWNKLEIREFFWKKRFWNEDFVKYANTFDLIIIGGGNYFELWVDKSPTGTSIEIELELYNKIKVPIFFNALGVDPGQGASKSSIDKFRKFIKVIDKNKGLITVRNDGAISNLEEYVGKDILQYIEEIPDGGFFINNYIENRDADISGRVKIGINVASDMPHVRFKNFENGSTDFSKEFAQAITEVFKKTDNCEFVFFPHIFKDLEIINEIINYLPDELRRRNLTVHEYSSGDRAAIRAFNAYKRCDLILGTRFHSNVCAISMNKKVVGLCNYMQIENLYKGLNYEEGLIDVRNPGFSKLLEENILKVLSNELDSQSKESIKLVAKMRSDFEKLLIVWLKESLLTE